MAKRLHKQSKVNRQESEKSVTVNNRSRDRTKQSTGQKWESYQIAATQPVHKVQNIPRNSMIVLFWFDYLAADMLGLLMCIDKVQNNPPPRIDS